MRKQKFYAIINKIIFSWQEEVSILIQIDIVDYDNLTSLGIDVMMYLEIPTVIPACFSFRNVTDDMLKEG